MEANAFGEFLAAKKLSSPNFLGALEKDAAVVTAAWEGDGRMWEIRPFVFWGVVK